jgi:hypothetical protein
MPIPLRATWQSPNTFQSTFQKITPQKSWDNKSKLCLAFLNRDIEYPIQCSSKKSQRRIRMVGKNKKLNHVSL